MALTGSGRGTGTQPLAAIELSDQGGRIDPDGPAVGDQFRHIDSSLARLAFGDERLRASQSFGDLTLCQPRGASGGLFKAARKRLNVSEYSEFGSRRPAMPNRITAFGISHVRIFWRAPHESRIAKASGGPLGHPDLGKWTDRSSRDERHFMKRFIAIACCLIGLR